jgi:uncharacterized protein (TIGR00251 family)
MIQNWIQDTPKGVVIRVQVQPQAAKSEIVGLYGAPQRLKIRIAAPPIEGRANEAILQLLKKVIRQKGVQFTIIRGENSKKKDLLFTGITMKELEKALIS